MPTKTFVGLSKIKQEKIFASAVKEFAEKGYSLASTNNICKEANISKGSVFQYFKSKEALFFFVVRKALREIIDSYKDNYKEEFDELSLKEIFTRSCFQHFEFYENYPYHYKLYLRINFEIDAPNYLRLRRYLAKYVSVITYKFIEIGKRRQLLREDISLYLIRFIINSFLTRFVEEYSVRNTQTSLNNGIFSITKREKIIGEIYTLLIEGISKK